MRYKKGDILHIEKEWRGVRHSFVCVVEETMKEFEAKNIEDIWTNHNSANQVMYNVYLLTVMKGESIGEGRRIYLPEEEIDFARSYLLFDVDNMSIEKIVSEEQTIQTTIPDSVKESIDYHNVMLSELYPDRDIDSTGGIILIVNEAGAITKLERIFIDVHEDIPEYTEVLSDNNEDWIVSLFLMTEFAVLLYMEKSKAPENLLNYIE